MSLIGICLSLVITCIFIYVLIYPPVNGLYRKIITTEMLNDSYENIIEVETIKFGKFSGVLYKIVPSDEQRLKITQNSNRESILDTLIIQRDDEIEEEDIEKDACIVWIHGGAFLDGRAYPHYTFYKSLATSTSLPVYVFDYPEHFKYKQKDCMDYMYEILNRFRNKKIHLCGDSAGAFYASIFLRNNFTSFKETGSLAYEKIPMTVINSLFLFGFFGYLTNTFLNLAFKFYFLRGIKDFTPIVEIPGTVMLITSDRDFLKSNSDTVKSYNSNMEYYSYDCDACDHDFQFIQDNTEEFIDIVERSATFIKEKINSPITLTVDDENILKTKQIGLI